MAKQKNITEQQEMELLDDDANGVDVVEDIMDMMFPDRDEHDGDELDYDDFFGLD